MRVLRDYGPALLAQWRVPRRRFVILTAGRTGSELLVSLLDSHPEIRCAAELLKEERAFPDAYISARSVMARVRGFQAFGWKLALNQFRSLGNPGSGLRGIGDPARYPARLHERGFKLILSTRRDPVAQALSGLRAMRVGYHHHSRERPAFSPLAVEPVDLLTLTRILETDAQLLARMLESLPHLRISYEDDLLDPARHQATVDLVCDYLGIDSAPVSSDLVKIAPSSLRECVTNYDEIASLFRSTRYAQYLGEEEKKKRVGLAGT